MHHFDFQIFRHENNIQNYWKLCYSIKSYWRGFRLCSISISLSPLHFSTLSAFTPPTQPQSISHISVLYYSSYLHISNSRSLEICEKEKMHTWFCLSSLSSFSLKAEFPAVCFNSLPRDATLESPVGFCQKKEAKAFFLINA